MARLRRTTIGALAIAVIAATIGYWATQQGGRTHAAVTTRARAAPASAPLVTEPSTTTSTTMTTTSSTTVPETTTTTSALPVELQPAPAPPPVPIAPPPGPLAAVYHRLPINDKVIFLGIDDGIVRDPQVLALLQHARIPITVFLTKPYGTADPAFWHAVQAAGGTIEDHTITHPFLTHLAPAAQRHEICDLLDSYQQMFGRRPTLFRPPYGDSNNNIRAIAASCGLRAIVMWSGSTNDGRVDFQAPPIHPGDILLMHWRTDLLVNIQHVLALCHQQGYAIGRLENYLSPGT
jgi:peptidoglycan/xylan/chitin deacetylase (PgdA/CDA1 family)